MGYWRKQEIPARCMTAGWTKGILRGLGHGSRIVFSWLDFSLHSPSTLRENSYLGTYSVYSRRSITAEISRLSIFFNSLQKL